MNPLHKISLIAALAAQVAFSDKAEAQIVTPSHDGDPVRREIQRKLYAAKPDPDAMAQYDMALLPESIDIDSIKIADEFFMGPSVDEVVTQAESRHKNYLHMRETDKEYFLSIFELKQLGQDYDAMHQRFGHKERYAHAELRLLGGNGFACHSLPDDNKHVTEMSGMVFRYASAKTILDIGKHEIGHQQNDLPPDLTREQQADSATVQAISDYIMSIEADADETMVLASSATEGELALLMLGAVTNGEIAAETDAPNKVYLIEQRDEQFALSHADHGIKPHPSLIDRIVYMRALEGFCENGEMTATRLPQYRHHQLVLPKLPQKIR